MGNQDNRLDDDIESKGRLTFNDRIDLLIKTLVAGAIAIGCYFVVQPFLTSIIIAAILAVVTWPLYSRARSSFGNTTTIPALIMVLLLITCVLLPTSFILVALAQQIPKAVALFKAWVATGFSLPSFISDIPVVGSWLHEQLLFAIDPSTLTNTLQKMIDPLTSWVLNAAVHVSSGLFQMALVTFIVFFFYRDGPWFADKVHEVLERVSGNLAHEMNRILINTTRSVVLGLLGTAFGQGIVAAIGFWIAGVPGILTLSTLVCILSIVPVGPPLIWGPAAVWLYSQGQTGMAIFLVLWGALAVSSVDNFLKPLLIARGTSLPLSLIFLGVFGGVIAFGFLGLILGPILLAVGIAMLQAWMKNAPKRLAERAAAARANAEATAHASASSSSVNAESIQAIRTPVNLPPSGEITVVNTGSSQEQSRP